MRFWTSPSLQRPDGRSFEATWERLYERFQSPREAESKESLARWAPARFRNDYRCLANVIACYAVVIDVDSGCSSVLLRDATAGLRVYAHTTWSSTPDATRWRVVVPLDTPVTADAYGRVWRWMAALLERADIEPDTDARDASRAWAVPCMREHYQCFATTGDYLPVARALVEFPAPPPPDPYVPVRNDSDVVERCRLYVEKLPPAISGSGGHAATFHAAQVIVRGFGLNYDDAMAVLWEYNQRCAPPWSVHELQHKLRQARARGTMQFGRFLQTRMSA